MPRAAGRRKVPPPVANGLGERVGLRWLLSRGKTVGEGFMSSDIATGIPESAARPRRSAVARRSRRALAVLLLGPLTILAGLVWAVAQPYRIVFLERADRGLYDYLVQPPLLVGLVGVVFALVVAPGLVEDLESEGDGPEA